VLLTVSFAEGRERTRAVAYYGAVAGIGASLGLLLGGILTDLISWRVGFFSNLPIGLAMILAAALYLPETTRVRGRLDVVGGLASTDTIPITAHALPVPLLAGFVVNESRARQPIMPLRLFASAERIGGYAGRILSSAP